MKRTIALLAVLMLTAGAGPIRSTPDLGKAEGRCRSPETGPAFFVDVEGLKDRRGFIKVEVYPATSADFLADDNVLVAAGKTFRRVEQAVPASGPVQVCIRIPGPGSYAVSVLHDRNANHRFNLSEDGAGFSRNPRLGLGKPAARDVAIAGTTGPAEVHVTMNYRTGLMSFGPLRRRN